MLVKKAPGRVIMDLRQEVMVWRIGKPLEAFSMIALVSGSVSLSLLTLSVRRGKHEPVNDRDKRTCQRAGARGAGDIHAQTETQILGVPY